MLNFFRHDHGENGLAPHLHTGRKGEDAAAGEAKARGWKILDRNWRAGRLELDIVCEDGEEIVFLEVKTRAEQGLLSPAEALSPEKCRRLTRAAQAWLDAVGTENEAEQTKKYISELEEDIVTVDDLISLAESEMGAKIFGAEKAKEVAAHGKEIKAAGAVYCDCPACAAVEKILAKKDEMLA